MDDETLSLGPCCGCETPAGARTVVMLALRCKIPGRGWGCVICHVPSDGASAVLCDECATRLRTGEDVIRFACRGWPGTDGRAPISKFTEPFDHDWSVDHDAA
jgi:hypothetical protein